MTERCIHAYRKRGKAAVFCKLIEGDDFSAACHHQYMCHQTRRWEVNNSAQCTMRRSAIVDKDQPKTEKEAPEARIKTAKKSTAKAKK